jgi:predicted small lipoprotein YifL
MQLPRGVQPSERRSTQSPLSPQRLIGFAAFAFIVVTGCGKKGPPLPPLVRLPQPPADLVAERRGDTVDVQFTVPSTNTDGTRPANVSATEVYAITAPATPTPLTDAQLLKLGTKVGSVPVKAPRDPNLTAEPDESADEVDSPEGPGLDQGTVARVSELLTKEMLTPVDVPKGKKDPNAATTENTSGPLLPAPTSARARTYAAFGTSTRGRKGPLSKRIVVPLVPPPPPPTGPAMTYDEKAVTVTWNPVALNASAQAPPGAPREPPLQAPSAAPARDAPPSSKPIADGTVTIAPTPAAPDILPSSPIGVTRPTIAYNVYDATNPALVVKLTPAPIAEPRFSDPRIAWDEERCYLVRTVEVVGGLTIESDPAAAPCDTLTDTFPPAAPKAVTAIPSEGAINLIWEPNSEKDLGGYIVMRGGAAPEAPLEPITPAPILEPSFKDNVPAGVQYAYAVKAVDKAGNASAPSTRVVESAR